MNTRLQVFRKIGFAAIGGVLWLCIAAASLMGATLADYRTNLNSAEKHIDLLLDSVARSEGRRRDSMRESEIILEIRGELPASQSLTWKGGSVETQNEWISEKLTA